MKMNQMARTVRFAFINKLYSVESTSICFVRARPVIKMQFGRSLDKFLKLFYICGLSCYPCFDAFLAAKTKKTRLMRFVPTAFLSALIVIIAIMIFLFIYHRNIPASSFIVLYSMSLLFTLSACAIQMVCFWPNFAEMCMHISIVEHLSWGNFQGVSSDFQRQFMRKVYIFSATYFLAITFSFLAISFTVVNVLFNVALVVLRVLIMMVLIQAFFYIDLLGYMQQYNVQHIDLPSATVLAAKKAIDSRFRSPVIYQLMAEILHLKLLHYHLWEVSQKINRVFGWAICIILMRNFIFAVMNIYFLYTIMTEHSHDTLRILRK